LSPGNPPSYFFASGHAHRLNPAGVYCLYFSEDEVTANAEYRKGIEGNFAIFKASLTPPDRVEILGDGTWPLEVLP
jgi:hypothetical protein